MAQIKSSEEFQSDCDEAVAASRALRADRLAKLCEAAAIVELPPRMLAKLVWLAEQDEYTVLAFAELFEEIRRCQSLRFGVKV